MRVFYRAKIGNYFLKHNNFINKDENVHRFALSAIRGELLERQREKERKERNKKGGQKV